MPLVSVGPETAMLTPILGKMPKTCQFSGAYLAAKLSLAAEIVGIVDTSGTICAGATSGDGTRHLDRRWRIGDEV